MSTPVKRTVTGEIKRYKVVRTPKTSKVNIEAAKRVNRKEIKKILNSMVEKKHAIVGYESVPLQTAIPSGVVFNGGGNFFKLMPQIAQSEIGEAGKAYNQRIGNEITLHELDINGYLSYAANRALTFSNSKLAVRMMILRAKDINDQSLLFDNMPTDQLLRFGSFSSLSGSGTTRFDGDALDSFRDINRDLFSVKYDKVHYLSCDTVITGATQVTTTYRPSGLVMFRHKMKFGESGLKLKYSSISDVEANNFPYFMVIGVSSVADGIVPADNLVDCTMQCVGTFSDA